MDLFVYLFSGLRWQDALDIFLTSYILFRFYVLFRGTRVIRALLTIPIFWAVGQAATSLGLVITNWAMQGVIAAAGLIIVIVFRNEISAVLQSNNLKTFLWGISGYQRKTPGHIITESVYELADKKIGALIVLPLKQGMASVVQEGILINGRLSQELLVSIFWEKNPLHDGAVIIEGESIKSAGAILPLSKREDLPSVFGTRHRAARGLAELTDAMVIVVSEERGMITVFNEDEIHHIGQQSDLTGLLENHIGDRKTGRGLRHPAVKPAVAAMICLLSISGLWY